MGKIVKTADQVVDNIVRFQTELKKSSGLQSRLGQIHAWYACRLRGGGWLFGPSKFVGYQDNTAKRYLSGSNDGADGRETEKALEQLAAPVDPDTRLGRALNSALQDSLAEWNRKPRKGARISVVSDEEKPESLSASSANESLLSERIVSDPEICGGRPSVRGTRMRVSDIVEMLALGATLDEILADYPYLDHEDISAALAYAARAADHRVIHAA